MHLPEPQTENPVSIATAPVRKHLDRTGFSLVSQPENGHP